MNNYEKIKQMSVDEMISFILNSATCSIYCKYINRVPHECMNKKDCKEGVKQWLLSESEV